MYLHNYLVYKPETSSFTPTLIHIANALLNMDSAYPFFL